MTWAYLHNLLCIKSPLLVAIVKHTKCGKDDLTDAKLCFESLLSTFLTSHLHSHIKRLISILLQSVHVFITTESTCIANPLLLDEDKMLLTYQSCPS